jgi:hypothetical protein
VARAADEAYDFRRYFLGDRLVGESEVPEQSATLRRFVDLVVGVLAAVPKRYVFHELELQNGNEQTDSRAVAPNHPRDEFKMRHRAQR